MKYCRTIDTFKKKFLADKRIMFGCGYNDDGSQGTISTPNLNDLLRHGIYYEQTYYYFHVHLTAIDSYIIYFFEHNDRIYYIKTNQIHILRMHVIPYLKRGLSVKETFEMLML